MVLDTISQYYFELIFILTLKLEENKMDFIEDPKISNSSA